MASTDSVSPVCPKCNGQGLARGVEIKGEQRTIRYVCATCSYEWHVTDPAPKL